MYTLEGSVKYLQPISNITHTYILFDALITADALVSCSDATVVPLLVATLNEGHPL